jgi:hypothetical protein
MGLGRLHQYRRSAGAVALAGMAFYVALLPWHTVSQATGPPLSFEPPCHQASTVGNAKTPQPAKPRTHCPICNGFAAFHFAAPASASALLVRPAIQAAILPTVQDGVVGAIVRAPQSRGPPSSST